VSQAAEILKTNLDLQPILKVEWPQPFGTIHYTLRKADGTNDVGFRIDPALLSKALLLGWPQIKREIDIAVDARIQFFRSEISVFNDPDDPNRIEQIFTQISTVKGSAATLYYVFDPGDGSVTSADWINLGDFEVEDYFTTTTNARLILVDIVRSSLIRRPGILVSSDDFPDVPIGSINKLIPYIFGEVTDALGILTEFGRRTSLQANINDSVGVIPVYDVTGFPASGTIIIGAEKISYTAIDSGADPPTIGTAGTPASRGVNSTVAVAHNQNQLVREKLARYRYIASYHFSISNLNVRIDNVPLTLTTDYVITETTLNDHAITYIDVTQMPTIGTVGGDSVADELDATLLVDVNGIEDPDSAGNVLEDIAGVIKFLVTDSDFANLDVSLLDTTLLDVSITAIGAGSWKLARRVYRPPNTTIQTIEETRPTNLDLLSEACWNVGLRLSWNGFQFKIFDSLKATTADAVRTLDVDDMFPGDENQNVRKRFDREETIINDLIYWYERGFLSDAGFKSSTSVADAISQAQSWGVQTRNIFNEWVRDVTTASGAAAKMLADNAWRNIPIETFMSLRQIDFDQGDQVIFNDPISALDNVPSRLIGTRFSTLDQIELKGVLSDRRFRIWEHDIAPADAVTFIDAYDGFLRWFFVIDNVIVAQLSFDGSLFIKGEIIENPFTGETVEAAVDGGGVIEYDGTGTNMIVFAVENEAATDFIRVMTLDVNGNLDLYELEEGDYPLTSAASPAFGSFPQAAPVGLNAYYLWDSASSSTHFTLDLSRTFLQLARVIVATKTNARLKIKEIIENAF
jgi:hypothetical protein